MIIEPFRSNQPGTARYHTNTLCPEGKAISSASRRPGDDGLSECDMCRALVGVRRDLDGDGDDSPRNDLLTLAQAEVLGGLAS